jgi:hypothetical protein
MSKIQLKTPVKKTTPKMSVKRKADKYFLFNTEINRGTSAHHPSHPWSYLGNAKVSKTPDSITDSKGKMSLRILVCKSDIKQIQLFRVFDYFK